MKRMGAWVFSLLVVCALLLVGGPGAQADPVEVVDEVHWTYTGPTSVALDWRGEATQIRYGPTTAYGMTTTAATPSPVPWSSAGPFREVEIGGLAESSDYHYSIGGGPDHTFHTAPAGSYRFVAVGDIGDSVSSPEVGEMMQQVGTEDAAFVLALGDLTYANLNCQAAVDQHFIDVQAWSFDTAYMPVWGNHEYARAVGASQPCAVNDTFANYKGRFALPNPQALSTNRADTSQAPGCRLVNGVNPCQGEDWYWFDAGPVRYVVGPEPFTGAVSEWHQEARAIMADAEGDPAIRYVVSATHRPAYSSAGRTTAEYTNAIDALGDEFPEYVLHLTGHVHTNEVFAPQHGVRHVIAGTGGRELNSVPAPIDGSELLLRHNGYARVDVAPSGLTLSVVCGPHGSGATGGCTPGEVVDTFEVLGAPPHAEWAATCVSASCLFDASTSTDREGPVSYVWDFGDGSNGTGVAPSHAFPGPGVYEVTLTVTDADGQTDTDVQSVTVGDPDAVAFRAAASRSAKTRFHTVTVPATVQNGDGLLALLSTSNPDRSLTVPNGWELVDTAATLGSGIETFLLERTASAGTGGTSVPLTLNLAAKGTATLLAYSGTAASGPVGAWALQGDTVRRASHETPLLQLDTLGAAVVSYWADKGATTSWSVPGSVTKQSESFGSGTGHTSAVAADQTGGIPAGPVGGVTATANSSSRHAVTATILLAPGL